MNLQIAWVNVPWEQELIKPWINLRIRFDIDQSSQTYECGSFTFQSIAKFLGKPHILAAATVYYCDQHAALTTIAD